MVKKLTQGAGLALEVIILMLILLHTNMGWYAFYLSYVSSYSSTSEFFVVVILTICLNLFIVLIKSNVHFSPHKELDVEILIILSTSDYDGC